MHARKFSSACMHAVFFFRHAYGMHRVPPGWHAHGMHNASPGWHAYGMQTWCACLHATKNFLARFARISIEKYIVIFKNFENHSQNFGKLSNSLGMQACKTSFCAYQVGMHKVPTGWHVHGMQTNMQSKYACLHAKKINTELCYTLF